MDATSFHSKAALWSAVDAWVADASAASVIYGHISRWDVSRITDMDGLFCASPHADEQSKWGCAPARSAFDEDISGWDVSRVTTMRFMFAYCARFNSPLNSWNVSRVTSMGSAFSGAALFDQNLVRIFVSNPATSHISGALC